jgi:DNA-binding transcriptional ArsR family regulator
MLATMEGRHSVGSPGEGSPNAGMTDLVAERFRVLGQAGRLQLVLLMLELGTATTQELADAAGLSRPNTSKHLQMLLRAELVSRRPERGEVFYRLRDPARVRAMLDQAIAGVASRIQRLSALVDPPALVHDDPDAEGGSVAALGPREVARG